MPKLISKDKLIQLVNSLAAGATLVGPVREGEGYAFRALKDAREAEIGAGTKTQFSFKEYLFPKTEPILRYRLEGKQQVAEDAQPEYKPLVIFGARPCDTASLAVLDAVFGWDYKDPFYLQRREQLTVLGVACTQPLAECFCTAVGLSPGATNGSDMLFTEIEPGSYLAEAVTDKGQELLATHAGLFTDTEKSKAEIIAKAEQQMQRKAKFTEVAATLTAAFDQTESWAPYGMRCVGCRLCAMVCPTCHCFDIVDEASLRQGERRKNWDACSAKIFTLHASGHNPRPTQSARYRQRVMHKFSYFNERFGMTMCVGCGRCGISCPVGNDIYDAVVEVTNIPLP